ncbi:MAG: VOC family protein [Desulfobacterota bacterium]|nr:VOC family protein [Thermodesulfobacteriota bacterium]MDW8002623.1 VOC family protein [Deltaproteobacteria bacterium]
MKLKLDHIGFVTTERERVESILRRIGLESITKHVPDEIQKVSASFADIGENDRVYLEILTPTSSDSPISNFLQKKGPGLHHLCFEVEDIEEAKKIFVQAGFRVVVEPRECEAYDINLGRNPKKTTKIAFLFIPNFLLVELIEKE